MKVSDFDFQLPEDLIAQQPCQKGLLALADPVTANRNH